jgi:hypothetical protein
LDKKRLLQKIRATIVLKLHQDFFENDEHSFAKKVEETFFENVDC